MEKRDYAADVNMIRFFWEASAFPELSNQQFLAGCSCTPSTEIRSAEDTFWKTVLDVRFPHESRRNPWT